MVPVFPHITTTVGLQVMVHVRCDPLGSSTHEMKDLLRVSGNICVVVGS